MKQILAFCILAIVCGASAGEIWDSRGLAIDDSLLKQNNLWLNEEAERGDDNGWVILPRGVEPDLVNCVFPPLVPSGDVESFNLSGLPYITFDGCSLYVNQKWEAIKVKGSAEHFADGKTTYKIGQPQLVPVSYCADPDTTKPENMAYATVEPSDLFKFTTDLTDCWGISDVLESAKPSPGAFTAKPTTFNLCPKLQKEYHTKGDAAAECLQRFEVPANQYGYGIYDSLVPVLAIVRGKASDTEAPMFVEYQTEFDYLTTCSAAPTGTAPATGTDANGDSPARNLVDDADELNLQGIVSSVSRINDVSQAVDAQGNTVCIII